MAEEVLKIRVDADTNKVIAFNKEVGATKTVTDNSATSVNKYSALLKTGVVVAAGAAAAAVAALSKALRDGIQEFNDQVAAVNRAAAVAAAAGHSYEELAKAAESIINPLVEGTDKLKMLTDLVQRGFDPKQAQQMLTMMGDIAATSKDAGQTVAGAMQQMVDGFVKGRIQGAELARLLPSLKGSLAAVGLSMGDLADGINTAQERQAVFNAVARDAQNSLGGLERYANTAAGAMEALHVTINEAKEALGTGFMQAISGVIPVIRSMTGESASLIDVAGKLGIVIGETLVRAFTFAVLGIKEFQFALELLDFSFGKVKQFALETATSIVYFAAQAVKALSQLPGATETLTQAYQSLQKQAAELAISSINNRGALSAQWQEVVKLGKAVGDLHDKAFAPLNLQLKELTPTASSAGGALDALGGNAKKAEAELKKLNATLEDVLKKGLADSSSLFNLQVLKPVEMLREEFSKGLDEWADKTSMLNPILSEFDKRLQSLNDEAKDMVLDEQMQAVYQTLAVLDPLWYQFLVTTGKINEEVKETGATFSELLGDISGIFSELADLTGSKKLGGLAEAFSGASQTAQGFGKIMEGDVLGGIKDVIAGIGDLIKGFKDLFGKDWTASASKMAQSIGFAISDSLAESIGKLGEEIGDVSTATILSLRDIADEIGITADNVSQFILRTRDLFSFLERGQITAAQAAEVLGSMWDDLAANATDNFGLISSDLRELITLSKQFGVEVTQINSFVTSQLKSGVDGFSKQIANSTIKTQGALDRFSTLALTHFNALIESGMSISEVMDLMGSDFAILSEAASKYGLSINDALSSIFEFQKINDTFSKQINVLDGVNAQLVALANTGNLSADAFNALERSAKRAATKIIADGKLSRAEWQAIAPTMTLLSKLSGDLGIALGKNTQQIIDMAKANGFLEASDPTDKLNDGISRLDRTMGNLNDTIKMFIRTLGAIPRNITTTVTTQFVSSGTPPPTTTTVNPPQLDILRPGQYVDIYRNRTPVIVDAGERISKPKDGTSGGGSTHIELHFHETVNARNVIRVVNDALRRKEIRV